MFHILLALFLASATALAAGQDLALVPPAGPYQVGVRVQQQYDQARVYRRTRDAVTARPTTGERARPIQSLVWYPAAGKGKPLRYRDYVETIATEDRFDDPALARRTTAATIAERTAGPRGAQVAQALERPMRARRDAEALPGTFPVLIYAPSHSASAMENADLCEYLASHGYIVIASASVGPRTRSMTSDLEGLHAQSGDIAFLIAQARTIRQADMERVAVVGFSWGGLANVLAAARDDRIRALVSIDGSVRAYPEYVDGGPKADPLVTPERLAIPMLYVARRDRPLEEINEKGTDTRFNLMNRMRYSDVYIATMHLMNHMDFSSWVLRINDDGAFEDHTREEAAQAYYWTARYIQRFFDAYLKDDKEALAFINRKPEQNQAPRHMMSMDARKAKAKAPTRDAFLAQLPERGFGRIVEIYDALHAQNATLIVDPVEIDDWGTQLLRAGRAQDAVDVFRLGVHVYPDGLEFLHDDLGEAYEAAGKPELAIASYCRALAINPRRAHAGARLKALGADMTETVAANR
nr:CocE/NonD family hydrolase [uncultured Massilia sp.]